MFEIKPQNTALTVARFNLGLANIKKSIKSFPLFKPTWNTVLKRARSIGKTKANSFSNDLFWTEGCSHDWWHYDENDLKEFCDKRGVEKTLEELDAFEYVYNFTSKLMTRYKDIMVKQGFDMERRDEALNIDFCEELNLENFRRRFTSHEKFRKEMLQVFYDCVCNWDAGYPYTFTFFKNSFEPIFMRIDHVKENGRYYDSVTMLDWKLEVIDRHTEVTNDTWALSYVNNYQDRFKPFIENVDLSGDRGFKMEPDLLEESKLLMNF